VTLFFFSRFVGLASRTSAAVDTSLSFFVLLLDEDTLLRSGKLERGQLTARDSGALFNDRLLPFPEGK